MRPLETREAGEAYVLRLELEPDAVALAAMRATNAERDFAIRTLATLDEVPNKRGEGAGTFNRAFHLAPIYPSAQNSTNIKNINDLILQNQVFHDDCRYHR